jgi:hypothetical protein
MAQSECRGASDDLQCSEDRVGGRVISFLTDLFEGKTSNLGHDLSNPLDDASADFSKQPSWAKDLEIAAPLALGAVATGGFGLLGEGAGLSSLFGGAGLAADSGSAIDLAGTGTDIFGDAGIAGQTAADTAAALPQGATLTAGTTPDAFAGAFDAAGAGSGTTSGVGGGVIAGTPGGDLATAAGGAGGGTSALDTASTVGAGSAGGGAAGGGGTGILSTIGSDIKAAAPFVGAAGVAGSLFEGYEQKQALNATNKQEAAATAQAASTAAIAQQTAAPLINQGQTLMTYLTSGTLPPQFQTQVDQTIASQKAGIIQGYASRGMSTNPQQNSQLQQDLAAVDNSRNTLMTQLESQLATAGQNMVNTANQMLATGVSATSLESQIPIQISKLNQQLNQSMMQSISNFAAAMNGGKLVSSPTATA